MLLLFCDTRELLKLEFTRESAEQLLRDVLGRVNDPFARAAPCEYCEWCACRRNCAARMEGLPLHPKLPAPTPIKSLPHETTALDVQLAVCE